MTIHIPYIAPVKRERSSVERYPGWAVVLTVITACIALWSAIYFLVTAALSLGSGS